MFNAVTYKEGAMHRQRLRQRLPLVYFLPQRGTSGLSNPFLGIFSVSKGLEWRCCFLFPVPPGSYSRGGSQRRCSSFHQISFLCLSSLFPCSLLQAMHLPHHSYPLMVPALGGLSPARSQLAVRLVSPGCKSPEALWVHCSQWLFPSPRLPSSAFRVEFRAGTN